MTYVIEDNVPMPPTGGSRKSPLRQCAEGMAIGQSLLMQISSTQEYHRVINTLKNAFGGAGTVAARAINQRKKGEYPVTIRFWRLK